MKAAVIVCPWAKVVNNTGKFGESAPFLFKMEDATFAKWMEVYELSREGGLVAYNGMKQKEVMKIADDPRAWELKKKMFRYCQGCSEADLLKAANYLLSGRLSIQRDKRTKGKVDAPESSTHCSIIASGKPSLCLEDFCVKKKYKAEFEILLLTFLDGENGATRTELKSLTKAARKGRVQRMLQHYQVDRPMLRQLNEALSLNDILKKALNPNKRYELWKDEIDPSLHRLIDGIKMSIDLFGNRVVKALDKRLRLRSLTELRSNDFPDSIVQGSRSQADLIFLDSTLVDGPTFTSEFYDKFLAPH